jgi:hypothetical protein
LVDAIDGRIIEHLREPNPDINPDALAESR